MKKKNTDFQIFIHFSCIIQDNRLISYCCEIIKKKKISTRAGFGAEGRGRKAVPVEGTSALTRPPTQKLFTKNSFQFIKGAGE